MPLCPQITNTPITVTQTADFTVTSVVPIVANTSDGLANNFQSIEILADGKTKVYRSATEPTGAGINDGDLWIDTDDGNKLYVRAGGVWTSAQDGAIATAQASANAAAATASTAQSTANTALTNAATAYNAAIGSLQPSANTIVNASNQITAINGSGITIYSGASSTTGSRIVLNSLGLAAYGPGNSFNITNVVGNGTTVTYTASGHNFTVGSTVTVSELAPAGYNGTFLITAVVAGSTFTVSNTTTATLTDSNGIAYGPGRSVNITNAVGNGSTVTYTASGHGYSVGTSVTISGLAPDGYNGTFLITSVVAGSTFTVSNGTTATLTDSSGVAQTATLAISATTGNAVFQGSVTGSTIIGGTLNIGGKAIIDSTGLLTATGATITGTINAEAGYFGTPTNGFSISSTGLVGVGTGTIVGGTIQGATFNNGSGTFFVSSAGVVTATSGTIGGVTLSSSALTGGKIQTSSGTNAVILDGSTNSMYFKYLGTVYGHILPASSGAVMIHYGATADPVGNSYPQFYVGSSAITIAQSTTRYALVDSSGLDVGGSIDATLDVTAGRDLFTPNHTTVTDTANGRVTVTLGRVTRSTASSQRYKENIVALQEVSELDPKKLLELPVRAFTYREDYLSESDSRFGVLIPGFIAEEVDAVYPVAADYENGDVESWNDRMIVPGLLALIQDLYKEITLLKGE
jgi:hypothetical protein